MKTGLCQILFISLGAIPLFSYSQIDLGPPYAIANGGAVTAKLNNWMAIGVNPANLGWSNNQQVSISLLNFGADFQAHSLGFPTLSGALTDAGNPFTNAQKQSWENIFSPPGLLFNSEVNWVSGSFFINKIGGFAFGLSDRVMGSVNLSRTASNILFNGINVQQYADSSITPKAVANDLAGSKIAYTHLRELGIDFGRKIFQYGSNSSRDKVQIFGGIGLNYIWGLADYQAQVYDNGIEGESSAYGSDLGEMFNAPGHGMGVDMGVSAAYRSWTFAVSIIDLGFVRWTHTEKTALDTNIEQIVQDNYGINSIYNTDIPVTEILQNSPAPDYTTDLPTQLRLGADFKPNALFEFSSDLVFPLNTALGNTPCTYYVLSGEIHGPFNFNVNAGVEASADGVGIPMGVVLGPTKIYIGTGDILSILGINKNPNLSLVVGIFRLDF